MLTLKILIIENDEKLSQLYKIVLNKAGCETVLASSGQEVWDIFGQGHIDLVITDVMMPVPNGCDLVKVLRDENPLIPMFIITIKDDYSPKDKSFTLGIDDYMAKPIDVDEMILRTKALVRRTSTDQECGLMVGATYLDYGSLTVSCGKDFIMLPQRELLFLYKLISYSSKIFIYIQLIDEIWGPGTAFDIQIIDIHINRLRKHFGHNHNFKITTVRGLKYETVVQ